MNKEQRQMKRLWLAMITGIMLAINLAITIANFWKPGQLENPVLCLVLWIISELYLIFFVYVNVFDKPYMKNLLDEKE